jgi:hypothetical protein
MWSCSRGRSSRGIDAINPSVYGSRLREQFRRRRRLHQLSRVHHHHPVAVPATTQVVRDQQDGHAELLPGARQPRIWAWIVTSRAVVGSWR